MGWRKYHHAIPLSIASSKWKLSCDDYSQLLSGHLNVIPMSFSKQSPWTFDRLWMIDSKNEKRETAEMLSKFKKRKEIIALSP